MCVWLCVTQVTKTQGWNTVARAMGVNTARCTNASHTLKMTWYSNFYTGTTIPGENDPTLAKKPKPTTAELKDDDTRQTTTPELAAEHAPIAPEAKAESEFDARVDQAAANINTTSAISLWLRELDAAIVYSRVDGSAAKSKRVSKRKRTE